MTEDDNLSSSSDRVGALGRAVHDHPLPAALIGAGLLWLLSGSRTAVFDRSSGTRSSEPSAGARSFSTTTSSHFLVGARERLTDLLERQPLALGAIGLGVGVAMASAVGTTKIEADIMGKTSASVQESAKTFAAAAGDRATAVADRVVSAVASEATAQGLAPDAIKESAMEVANRVGRVVSGSVDQLKGSQG